MTRGLVWSLLLLACVSSLNAQTTEDVADGEDDPVKIFNRAQDAHAKGDLARAIALYIEAIKVRPEFPEAEFQKGVAHVTKHARMHAEINFFDGRQCGGDKGMLHGSFLGAHRGREDHCPAAMALG